MTTNKFFIAPADVLPTIIALDMAPADQKRAEAAFKPAKTMEDVFCRFWEENGVWNISAVNLPVAVFGKTFKQAKDRFWDAVICHLQNEPWRGNEKDKRRSRKLWRKRRIRSNK